MRKVAIDTQVLQYPEKSGYGSYVSGLVTALKKRDDIELIEIKSRWRENLSTVKRFIHDALEFPFAAQTSKADVVHQPCFSAPWSRKPVVWTLHDLRPLILKEKMSLPASLYWRVYLPWTQRFAKKIVCISENTRQDVIRLLKRKPEDVLVIPIGVDQKLKSWIPTIKAVDEVKAKFGITKPYFTSLGTIQPIKNFPFLIDVFVALRKEYNLIHQLVIIGKKGWDYPTVKEKIEEHKLTEGVDVIITDYVLDEDKWSLLAGSEVLLFPSLYEGFGIPPIEAQFLRVPVIASNTSSLPDVVGNAGVLCSPEDTRDWVAAYAEITKNREDFIARGLENVKRFDWDVIAEQWVRIYHSL